MGARSMRLKGNIQDCTPGDDPVVAPPKILTEWVWRCLKGDLGSREAADLVNEAYARSLPS